MEEEGDFQEPPRRLQRRIRVRGGEALRKRTKILRRETPSWIITTLPTLPRALLSLQRGGAVDGAPSGIPARDPRLVNTRRLKYRPREGGASLLSKRGDPRKRISKADGMQKHSIKFSTKVINKPKSLGRGGGWKWKRCAWDHNVYEGSSREDPTWWWRVADGKTNVVCSTNLTELEGRQLLNNDVMRFIFNISLITGLQDEVTLRFFKKNVQNFVMNTPFVYPENQQKYNGELLRTSLITNFHFKMATSKEKMLRFRPNYQTSWYEHNNSYKKDVSFVINFLFEFLQWR